jgi:hypothetical protein
MPKTHQMRTARQVIPSSKILIHGLSTSTLIHLILKLNNISTSLRLLPELASIVSIATAVATAAMVSLAPTTALADDNVRSKARRPASSSRWIVLRSVADRGPSGIPAIRTTLRDLTPKYINLNFSAGIDLSTIQPAYLATDLDIKDFERYIPLRELKPDDDKIAARIVDHSLNQYLNSPAVKGSSFGRTARRVENSLKADVAWTSGSSQTLKHNVKALFRPTQATALLEYTGLTTAQLIYTFNQSLINFETVNVIDASGVELIFNHIKEPNDIRDIASLRWKF